MSENTIPLILQTLTTIAGLVAALVITMLIYFFTRTDTILDQLRELQRKSEDPTTRDRLMLAIDRGTMSGHLSIQKDFVKDFFVALVYFVTLFVISIGTLTTKHFFFKNTLAVIVYILVFVTISGFVLMIYFIFKVLRYYGVMGDDSFIFKVLRYYGVMGDDSLVQQHLFYKGALWMIVSDNETYNIEIINYQTKVKQTAFKNVADKDLMVKSNLIFNSPAKFIKNNQFQAPINWRNMFQNSNTPSTSGSYST